MPRSKPKFSKKKCLKCKYHGIGIGFTAKRNGEYVPVYCNYTNQERGSCLRRIDSETSYDIRGDDYWGCRLYEEGEANEGE